MPFGIIGLSHMSAGDGVGSPGPASSGCTLDCCELEAHILYSATLLPIEAVDEVPRPVPSLDFSSLESNLTHLNYLSSDESGNGLSYRVLGAELERELDHCLDERAALLAAFDGRVGDDGSGQEFTQGASGAPALKTYIIESILAADVALSYDQATDSFYRITLNPELDSGSEAPLLGNQLHKVPSVYESMLLGFLTAAILSQRPADPKDDS